MFVEPKYVKSRIESHICGYGELLLLFSLRIIGSGLVHIVQEQSNQPIQPEG